MGSVRSSGGGAIWREHVSRSKVTQAVVRGGYGHGPLSFPLVVDEGGYDPGCEQGLWNVKGGQKKEEEERGSNCDLNY